MRNNNSNNETITKTKQQPCKTMCNYNNWIEQSKAPNVWIWIAARYTVINENAVKSERDEKGRKRWIISRSPVLCTAHNCCHNKQIEFLKPFIIILKLSSFRRKSDTYIHSHSHKMHTGIPHTAHTHISCSLWNALGMINEITFHSIDVSAWTARVNLLNNAL